MSDRAFTVIDSIEKAKATDAGLCRTKETRSAVCRLAREIRKVPEFTWDTRTLGGTATMYGIDENVGFVSTPPKKYLRSDSTGFFGAEDQNIWVYITPVTTTGHYEVSAANGNDISLYTGYINGLPNPGVAQDRPWLTNMGSVDVYDGAFVINSTEIRWNARPGPASGGTPFAKPSQESSDTGITSWIASAHLYVDASTYREVLSRENTEENAWNATVGDVGTWSAWQNLVSCVARKQSRGTGFTWIEDGVQYRIYTPIGGEPGAKSKTFLVTVETETRPYSGGTWVDGDDVTFTLASDTDGLFPFTTFKLPCNSNTQRRIKNVVITTI